MRGWERRGESSSGDGRLGVVRGGQSGVLGDGLGSISPLTSTLVAGAKKVFQNVSEDALDTVSAFPHDANVLTGRDLSRDCTTTNRRADSDSSGAHGLARIRPSPIRCIILSRRCHGKSSIHSELEVCATSSA
jgi:hypothetical protein